MMTATTPPKGRWSSIHFGPVEILLLMVAASWGGSYTATKLATQQLPVMEFLVLRFGITFAILLPSLRGLVHVSWRKSLGGAMLLGLNLLAIFLCETFGIASTTASNAAFLISMCVAFTPLCEWWLLKQKLTANVMTAMVLCLAGAALLAFRHGMGGLTWGDGLIIMAALLRGIMVCMTRRHVQLHNLPALTMTAVQMGVMTVGSVPVLLIAQGDRFISIPTDSIFWVSMAFLILPCTILAFYAQNYASSRTNPSRIALLMGSEPLWGALIAELWMGETIGALGWLGGALIMASIWRITRPTRSDAMSATQ